MKPSYIVVALACALLSNVALAAVPAALPDAGLLLINQKQSKSLSLPVYQEPKPDSPSLGNILYQEEANPTHATLIHVWEEPNPDAGLFSKKIRKMRTVDPMNEYITSTGWLGMYVYEAQAAWLRLDHGWVKRSDFQKSHVKFMDWKEAQANKGIAEFMLPEARDVVGKNKKIDEVRSLAIYAPIGELPVFNDPNNGTEIIKATAPLRFAIIGYQGDWVNVFIVLDACAEEAGKNDYREGTTGWVPKLDKKGKPTMMSTKSPTCQ